MAASSNDRPVHQLWPFSESKQNTELNVVFFHGLQLTANDTGCAWRSTWTQRGHDDVCWPQKWLPTDLGVAVRIFSVSYNPDVVTSTHGHVSEIADYLFQTLINPRYEWQHPIVLIGHSFGGLVLKSLVVKLKRRVAIENATDPWAKAIYQCAKVFLSNLRGVTLYAVPYIGSNKFAEYVKDLLRCNNRHLPGIMDDIQPFQKDMAQLSKDFDRIIKENDISIYAFCEGKPMEQMGILVDFGSIQRLVGANFYTVEDANHMEVCKPPSKEHPSYNLLLQFIIVCAKERRECDRPLQEVHDLPQSTFGLESYVKRVETLVTSEGRYAASQYVGVCGMGGVGKSLLLQRVYGSSKVRGCFQGAKFIWLTVGKTPHILTLYRSLSIKLGLHPNIDVNEEDYKHYLHTQFIQKRVFLVLNDVWKDEMFDALNVAKGEGSVTLLCTRNESLFERASPHIRQVHMTPLSKEDSWSLFCVHAFRPPSNVRCELKPVAQSVAEKCGGIPLILKIIGRAMCENLSPKLHWVMAPKLQWEEMLEELGEFDMQEMSERKLTVAYDCLDHYDFRLKYCFLYFAAFPENFKISFSEVSWHWTGEGLVPTNVGDNPREDVLSLLHELQRRSFVKLEGFMVDEENLVTYKLCDVMRDLAFFIIETGLPSRWNCFYRPGQNLDFFPEKWNKYSKQNWAWNALRLSLQDNNLKELPLSFKAPKLRFLLLGGNQIVSLPGSFLRNLRELRVLDLSGGQFSHLPEKLDDLEKLVWLNLSGCKNLKSLPVAVGKLHLLKHLNLNGCENLAYLPSAVAEQTSLQVLCTTLCHTLTWAERTPSVIASLEGICGLVSLRELHICGDIKTGSELPHKLSALTNLDVLRLGLRNISTLPAEMPYWFIQLQELYLCDLEILEDIPSSFTFCGAFPALLKFEICQCGSFVKFPEVEQDALPKLQTLKINSCESLKNLPLSLAALTSLTKLNLVNCKQSVTESCRKNCEKSSKWRKLNILH